MRRKAVINYRTRSTASRDVVRELAGSWHLHFCVDRDCRMVYEDFACADVGVNGRCYLCRGWQRPRWHAARDPQTCCHDNCAVVTDKTELVRYRLAGPGPWFQCQTCARSHGWPCTGGD